MPNNKPPKQDGGQINNYRRKFLKGLGALSAAATATTAVKATAAVSTEEPAWGGSTLKDVFGDFFQDQYQRMTPDEIKDALARI
jgi:hypothetical protein